MGMEKMNLNNAAELFLSDNRAQVELAKFAYRREHPEVVTPTHREVMTVWVSEHSEDFRKVADTSPEVKLKLDDESSLEEIYERILAAHETRSATMH